ncbi:uncharacterized protein DEA37_0010887 [Paragonimus westermani]|uniref:Uncharacterized protein n=1 Tax=Paragonimus westermani TaxID=34504 RepID=A0A5J4NR77_9TREM|nr:uncharacterized protein DEA37_0010887 [Paragonimus westermani]
MACNPSDVDEECYVYPAITKRYSQVTLPNQRDINTDNQDQPEPLPQVPTRPLRSTLKARSQFGPEAKFTTIKFRPHSGDQYHTDWWFNWSTVTMHDRQREGMPRLVS